MSQTSLNVTNFGAIGDAVQFSVNTVSNSVVVSAAGTNSFSPADVGKVIEVFGVGTQTYGTNSQGVLGYGNQDLIATITNVVSATNIYISLPCQLTTTNTFATYGTDNTPAFSNAVVACSSYTNAIINIPQGTYLCMPTFCSNNTSYAFGSILIHRGGLEFAGAGQTNSILLSRGAWQDQPTNAMYAGSAFRGFLIELCAPITNNYPLIFENLTLDGGVSQGNTSVHGIKANPVDGKGWDQQHSAFLAFDSGDRTGTAVRQMFTNVTVQHWRGEMLKSIDQNTNGNMTIENCSFIDGNATALNIFMSQVVSNCLFNNLFQTAEIYQSYYTNTSYFVDNFVTNITYNGWAWNGGLPTSPPYLMQSNTFYFNAYGMNGIQTTPGANISILNNRIHCAAYMTVFAIGTAGSQGSFVNSNIVISGNTVYADANNSTYPGTTNVLTAFVGFGGPGVTSVSGLTIASNTVIAGTVQDILNQGAYSSGVVFSNNAIIGASAGFDMNAGNPMIFIQTNNTYTPRQLNGNHGTTNVVSYGGGPLHPTQYVQSGATFVLQDTNTAQIPIGAQIFFDNSTNTGGTNYFICPSQSGGDNVVVSKGQTISFVWNGKAWDNAMQFTSRWAIGAAPFATQFTGPSVDSSGIAIIGWSWNFGDGTTSTAQNPSHLYAAAGAFTPTLVVTNSYGAVEVVSGPAISVGVLPLSQQLAMTPSGPNVNLSWPTNATGYTLQYTTNLSSPYWIIMSAAPTIANGQNVLSVPMVGGQMFFRLLMAGTVAYTARWTAGTAPFATAFSCPSADSLGYPIIGWSWSFGDGSTSTVQNPSHTFAAAGVFTPTLVVTNNNGVAELASGPAINVTVLPISPHLAMLLSGANATLTWPTNATGYILECATNLASPLWVPVSALPSVVNGQNVLNLPVGGGQMYFRLEP